MIKDISNKRIVLVDVLPRESFMAAQRCLTLDVFNVDRLGDDWGASSRIADRIVHVLQHEGYTVDTVSLPADFEDRMFPLRYMKDPGMKYSSRWDPRLTNWLQKTGAQHDAQVVVFLTSFLRSLPAGTAGIYQGYGVVGATRCIGIPPTKVEFYAHTGINVFTLPEARRNYFSEDSNCDVDVPDNIEDLFEQRKLKSPDLLPYAGMFENIGVTQIEIALNKANILHSVPDACPKGH